MKVLMLSPHGTIEPEVTLGGRDTGGQVAVVMMLAEGLQLAGHQVTIVNHGPHLAYSLASGVQLWRRPAGIWAGQVPKEKILPRMAALVDEVTGTWDVAVGHYADGMEAARLMGLPFVAMPHSLGKWKAEAMGTDYDPARYEAELAALAYADEIVATSAMQATWLQTRYNVRATAVIPPPIASRYTLPGPHRPPEQRRPDTVLAVGRWAANKNYDRLVEAAALASTYLGRMVQLRVAVGSDPDARDHLVNLASQLNVDLEVLHPAPTDPELHLLYGTSQMFAMPSLYEPFGMTAAEALACHTPTLVPTNGGLWNSLPAGMAEPVVPGKMESIANAMVNVLRNPEAAQRRADAGAVWVQDNLNLGHIVAQWEPVLHRAAERYLP